MAQGRTAQRRGSLRALALAVLAGLLATWAFAGSAEALLGCGGESAGCPPKFGTFGEFGAQADQIANPRGIGADPVSGHVFVTNALTANQRVNEFTAWGEFVRAWGWGVLDGEEELQVCTGETGCQAGIEGDGAGQFAGASGATVDADGNLWTLEFNNHRAQKFSPEGEFLLMIGGEVNKTTEEDICTEEDLEGGEECGAGVVGGGPGEFEAWGTSPSFIESTPAETIYVGGVGRIQEFGLQGEYLGEIELPEVEGEEVEVVALAVDPDGFVYVVRKVAGSSALPIESILKLDPATGEPAADSPLEGDFEDELGVNRPLPRKPKAVAADAEGNVYVLNEPFYEFEEGGETKGGTFEEAIAFDPDGNLITGFDGKGPGFGAPEDESALTGIAANVLGPEPEEAEEPGDVYIGHFNLGTSPASYVRAWGPVPGWPGPVAAPEIADQYASAVGTTDASVRGRVNPRGGEETTYWAQYGTSPCDEGGCTSTTPLAPLGGGAVNVPVLTAPIALSGLSPDMTYHYRLVAENEYGGPIVGVGGSEGEDGAEATFTTYRPGGPSPCPNDAFRAGFGAALPDCRGYELVSPLDKATGDVVALFNTPGYPAKLDQSAPGGEKLTYSAYRSFADPDSSPYTSQYIVERTERGRPDEGWRSHSISPRRERVLFPGLDTQFKAFTEDLRYGWLRTAAEPPLDEAEAALPGYRNLYRRDDETGAYLSQCPTPPPTLSPTQFNPEVQGVSADGSHMVFRAKDKLTPDAAPAGTMQVYECVGGEELRLVSVLPGGEAQEGGASAGIGRGFSTGPAERRSILDGAISEDGSRVFWTAAEDGPGPLDVRVGGTQTIEIAAAATTSFWKAAANGSAVLYSTGNLGERKADLHLTTIDAEAGEATSTPIAGEAAGVMGASEDLSVVYLVSDEDRDEGASAGEPNLYRYEAGTESLTFIATLAEEDARAFFTFEESAPILTPVAGSPYTHSARVSPDGEHLAFTSSAWLTGYDNTDQASGQADAEVFVYDAGADQLICASCNPSGARPRGENIDSFWAAAHIPGWENSLYAPRPLSDDGSRLVFEAADPLALADTNGAQDVYQWEAPGKGTCTPASPTYSPANEGCVDLISSGAEPGGAEFVDASADGRDVFIRTAARLWSPDPGLIDIYDARVGGGFAPPPPPTPPCEGEACQSPPGAPEDPTPSSSTYEGPGNARPSAGRGRCKRAARRAKAASRRAKRARRAARAARNPRKAARAARAGKRNAKRARRQSKRAKRCRARARRAAR